MLRNLKVRTAVALSAVEDARAAGRAMLEEAQELLEAAKSEVATKEKELREAEDKAELAKRFARSERESVLDVQALRNDLRRLENAVRLAAAPSNLEVI